MKYTKKQARQLANKSELERLKEELAKKNQELYDTKLGRDLLKNRCPCSDPQSQEEKPNSGSDQRQSSITAQEAAL